MNIITDKAALQLLINTYAIKQLDSAQRPVDQEKFIECVQEIFLENDLNYPKKQILTTWKKLLETYYHFKENFSTEEALKTWSLFSVMDNCFDASKSTSEKFSDPNLTFYLIECMSEYKQVLLNQGLTMNILCEVENKFNKLENNNINQKDIFIQWNNLKNCYDEKEKQVQSLSCFHRFLEAMEFYIYNTASQNCYSNCIPKRPSSENQLVPKKKSRKLDIINNSSKYSNLEMNKDEHTSIDSKVSSNYAVEALEQFNDNSSKSICESIIDTGHSNSIKNIEIESKNNTRKDNSMKENKEIVNKYETGYKELAELKELLLENNLLREEFKYLLGLFLDKVKTRGFRS